MLTAYFTPSQGEVLADGENIYNFLLTYKSKIGYLPENNPLYTDMFIIDFLEWTALVQGVNRKNLKKRLQETLHFCGLETEKHKRIGALSKGYRQRVGLAQAIIHDPEVLILDEPTTGLDPNQVTEIRELIKTLGKEKAILFSTHILREVEEVCNRIIIVHEGRIATDSPVNKLSAKATAVLLLHIEGGAQTDTETVQMLSELNSTRKVSSTSTHHFQLETDNLQAAKKQVFDLCSEQGWNLVEMRESSQQLEDIFRQFTTNKHE